VLPLPHAAGVTADGGLELCELGHEALAVLEDPNRRVREMCAEARDAARHHDPDHASGHSAEHEESPHGCVIDLVPALLDGPYGPIRAQHPS
jgi:hypothetical protein